MWDQPGGWSVSGQLIEAYDEQLELVGSWYLDSPDYRRLRADRFGRLFLIKGGDVYTVVNPLSGLTGCFGPAAEIDFEDLPLEGVQDVEYW
jgi:hypothetical protein